MEKVSTVTILCSAEKGELPISECLSCALAGDPPCGYSYPLLKSILGDDEKSNRANEIHVTDLTGCTRKAWYDKTDPSPEYVHEKLTRWLGTQMHKVLEGTDQYLDSELRLAADGIVGTADVVFKNGTVIDFKTTRWIYPARLPYGSHSLQVNVYAWMLRQMGREVNSLYIQYIDASGPSKCRKCKVPVRMIGGVLICPKCKGPVASAHLGAVLVEVPLLSDREVLNAIQSRKENLEGAIAMGIAPEREPGYLCSYCSHYDKCQPDISVGG